MSMKVETGLKVHMRFTVKHPPYETMTAEQRAHLGLPDQAGWDRLSKAEQDARLTVTGEIDQLTPAAKEATP